MISRLLLVACLATLFTANTHGVVVHRRSESSGKPSSVSQVWKLDATYADQINGIEFKYPSAWKSGIDFAYNPPALSVSDHKPIAGFGYGDEGFWHEGVVGAYSLTNLEAFSIVYSVTSAASPEECESIAASVADSNFTVIEQPVVLGGRAFSRRKVAVSGMSQTTEGILYATSVRHRCYLIETDLSTVDGYDVPKPLTSSQLRFIAERLLKIMKTVRINPPERGI